MMRYNRFVRLFGSLVVVIAMTALSFVGCTEVDDSLGAAYIPGTQQLKIGHRSLNNCFTTRLYRTDSIRTSNIESGLLGSTKSDTFGVRTAGFMTQFTWGYCPDSIEGYGYRPIFDSLMMGFLIDYYTGDTTRVRQYEVYEVEDYSFLENSTDTLFYGSFDPEPYLSREPLFRFTFPDPSRGVYVNSTAVRLFPTPSGEDFVERLMLKRGAYTDNDMTGYYDDQDWISHFKGLYFRPVEEAKDEAGALYSFDISETGLMLYGRNRRQEDPTLIQDTTISLYYFYDAAADAGNVSITTLRHNYAGSLLGDKQFEETCEERSLTDLCLVEGMAGVVTEITIEPTLFEQLQAVLDASRDASGKPYNSLAINLAVLSIFDEDTPVKSYTGEEGELYWDVDWEHFAPSEQMIHRMDESIQRLGLYTAYKGLVGIPDYAYVYEKTYGVTLNYGGYLNRSRGCYSMDIASHLQVLWNEYHTDKEAFLANPEKRVIYLAPDAYEANTFRTMTARGMTSVAGLENSMKIEITYTLVK